MVPSWTETLLWADVNVVGRTRYCIHPSERVSSIPVVGGTKDIRWSKVQSLSPDLILFDREENPRSMADDCPFPFVATHVTDLESLSQELTKLSSVLSNPMLASLANRTHALVEEMPMCAELNSLPGIREWWVHPKAEIKTLLYVIWRNPWMIVSRETFIGSVLKRLGFGGLLPKTDERYPQIDLADFERDSTLLLFSTEPYAFERERHSLEEMGFPCALLDGEAFSWFGIRTVHFLESWTSSFKQKI